MKRKTTMKCINCGKEVEVKKCENCGTIDYQCECGYGSGHFCSKPHEICRIYKNDDSEDIRDYSMKMLKNNAIFLPEGKRKVWLVKDGSVDIEKLELLGINYILYRDTKPTIVEF